MYAIIATGGKQYKVSEGDIIDIEKIEGENGTEVTFDKVICIGGDTMKVGADVEAATVTGTVMDQFKGRKAITRRTVTDSFTPALRSTRSTADRKTFL